MNIDSRSILVKLSVSQWSGTKSDMDVSYKVARQHQAQIGAGTYSKKIVKSFLIDEFRRVANEARQYHIEHTLPWMDGGYRILPTTLYFEYVERMRQYRVEADRAVGQIVKHYNAIIEQSRVRLGEMFNIKDYPRAEEIANKFGIGIDVMPVPTTTDWRVDLGAEEVEILTDRIEKQMLSQQQAAMKEVWDRAYAAVEHMAERLGNADTRFKESMLVNIEEIANLLPKLNIADDPHLNDMAHEIKQRLVGHNATVLRQTPEQRKQVADSANDILAKMAGYMGKEEAA